MREHTSESRFTMDFSFKMMDGAYNVVTKCGKFDQMSQRRLQLHCEQEPFLNEIER